MHTDFKFNRGTVTNTSKCNLAKGLDLKNPIKVPCHKKNVFCQNFNENIKRCLISSTGALDLLCQVKACMPI